MWDEYLKLILEKYKDKPDDFNLSIGHWKSLTFLLSALIWL